MALDGFNIKQSNNEEWIGCIIGWTFSLSKKNESMLQVEKVKLFGNKALATYSKLDIKEVKDITEPGLKDKFIEFAIKFKDGNWARVEVDLKQGKAAKMSYDNFMAKCFTKFKDPFD